MHCFETSLHSTILGWVWEMTESIMQKHSLGHPLLKGKKVYLQTTKTWDRTSVLLGTGIYDSCTNGPEKLTQTKKIYPPGHLEQQKTKLPIKSWIQVSFDTQRQATTRECTTPSRKKARQVKTNPFQPYQQLEALWHTSSITRLEFFLLCTNWPCIGYPFW